MAVQEQALGGHRPGLAFTVRQDAWWIGPALTVLGLTAFIVYSTWAAFQNEHYLYKNYLSPFYSPVVFTDSSTPGSAPAAGHAHSAWFGEKPSFWPAWLPFSPAFLILAFPGAFRFTCYYYRKAYYRSFTLTPPACAVGALPQPRGYRGETFLLLFQNLHRYAMYFALAFIVILAYDAVVSYFRDGVFGIGVGSIVLTINVILLSCYTFGCHSFRHLIGGHDDCMSSCSMKLTMWKGSSCLNARHMLFAWMSLFWVGFSDLYVRLVSMGIWTDFNTWGN